MAIARFAAATGGSYSDAVAVSGPGRWIHVSGQVGFGPAGTVTGTLYEQTHRCFDHLETALVTAGGALTDTVRITAYLVGLDDYPEFATARAERFGDHPPASAAVGVSQLLFSARVEIDAVAFLPD
ncbi:RidA family protein [Mycolicibacterium komossense]|uniref:RidA family protein n=1 Tax=Mycolicibacterium komossense TaxID=1779 RepID=A0ABT3C9Q6_9MYCO|nr:RidA family protein [Mycolicibacterium komossense]MCV7226161.1 RidA family protein [Mycolicibacterium komossense]